jgi:3-hydroxy-3-methylglutaryl CoA synthase/uncharacterized OB-fold protein
MAGIISFGPYIPYRRLERRAIAEALGTPPAKGTRSVASYDEDTTSMGAEAARLAMAAAPSGPSPKALYFATAEPPYLEKTNATAIMAALGLPHETFAVDMMGSVRSGVGAFIAALDAKDPALVTMAGIRTGLPGGPDETNGGDGAVAFLCGASDQGVIAEYLGSASTSAEFLDRWRLPGDEAVHIWEERFGEFAYVPLAEQAVADGLAKLGISREQVDHVVATGVHPRSVRTVVTALGLQPDVVAADFTSSIGNTGAPHFGLMLADVLARAKPNQLIAVLVLADGATIMFFRTTDAIATYRPKSTVQEQLQSGRDGLSYQTFLTWRDVLRREPPRRPDPDRPAAPPSFRSEHWKYGFCGSRCEACGTRSLPPSRVCIHCHAIDKMKLEPVNDDLGTIATFTIDHLAYSPSPPMVAAVVDFDGGGRLQCELTDVDADTVGVGQRVEMTFRKLYTSEGVHNYFWKARPVRRSN